MILHLPPALRAGLMACLALLPAPAFTFATASLATAALLATPAQAAEVSWDTNWGAEALADAPTSIADPNVLSGLPDGYTFLARNGSPQFMDGLVAVQLAGTAAGAQDVKVVAGAGSVTDSAGAGEGPLTADTWLHVTGGSYHTLVGGSYAQNYNGGAVSSFTGDSHILLTGQGAGAPTAAYIIGGNYKDGQSAPFNGHSYISVKGGQVTGSIVGGGTSAHLATAAFNGNSGIWLYTPLASSGAALHDLPNNLVVGGSAGIANAAPKLAQVGNSSVNADLSAFTPAAGSGTPTMAKMLIGGAWLKGGTNSTQQGNSSVSVTGTVAGGAAASFTQMLLGGSYLAGGGTAEQEGSATLRLSGGTYSSYIIGGNFFQTAGGSSTISGDVETTISGGASSSYVTGGSFTNSSGGSSTIGGAVRLTLSDASFGNKVAAAGVVGGAGGSHRIEGGVQLMVEGGSFDDSLAAGAYFHNSGGTAAIVGGTQLTIAGGTFKGMVLGGHLQSQRGASSRIEGGTTLDIRSGTFSQALVGGSYVTASDTVSASSTISGTTRITLGEGVQMNGAEARVIGGSYENTGITDITTGDVELTINGGSYGGDIIGGSYITGTGASVNTQRSGAVTITVNGGTLSGALYGGTYTMRGADSSVNEHGAVRLSLLGGTVAGNVYAGGGVSQAGTGRSGVQVASTTVEVGNGATLGAAGAGIIVSGGVLNSNPASSVAGDRTLLLSGTESYTNLDNVEFRGFNVVDNAADASIKLRDSDAAFTKRGAGTLTILGAASNLNPIDSFSVEQGVFDAGTAWVTHGDNGLSAISVGAGAEFKASGLTLEDSALLTLDLSQSPTAGMVTVAGNGSLQLLGEGRLELALTGVESLFPGSTATLLTWNNGSAPLTLDKVLWTNKGTGMDAYELAIEGQNLVLKVSTVGVYIAGAGQQATEVGGYQNFGAYQSVAVMPDETLRLTLDGAPDSPQEGEGALVNNLIGGAGSSFVVENGGTDGSAAVVILNNEAQAIDPVPGGLPGDPEGADTVFAGSIRGSGGEVEFIKRGAGTLSVGGSMEAHQLSAEEGTVELLGGSSQLDTLSLEGGTAAFGGAGNAVGSLEDSAAGGTLALAPGSELELTGESMLDAARISGTTEGAGTLQLGGKLTLADAARLAGVALELAGSGTLVLDGTAGHWASALGGTGTLGGQGTGAALALTGQGGSFGGRLEGTGTLTLEQGAQQAFAPTMAGAEGWNVVNKGQLSLLRDQGDGSNAPLTLGFVTLEEGSRTSLLYNSDAPSSQLLDLGALLVGQGAALSLSSSGADEIVVGGTPYIIGKVRDGQAAGTLGKVDLNRTDAAFLLLDADATTLAIDPDGNIVLNFVASKENKLAELAGNPNSATGAELLWNAATSGLATPGGDLRQLLDALGGTVDSGTANRAMAAAAGAGTAVLGMALAGDVERQLRAIRNRTTTMGVNPDVVNEGMPYFHAWVNGEGDFRKMDAEGNLPGYELTTWGGTLGMDADISDSLTAGLAFTAMHGDLDAQSADRARGELDTCYASAFARLSEGRWLHTFVGTLGYMDARLRRHVDYGSGSYSTRGDTDGLGIGLLYEVGYTLPMDEDSSFLLQPIANVAWRHVGLDAYSETGSDAALRVDGKDYDLVTFGLGARAMAVVGENLYNRRSWLEARALLKVDAGEREGEAGVAFLGGTAAGRVRSAEPGAAGVELGMGLTVPLGQESGSLFLDGSVELRGSYTHANGVIGYRLEF